MAKENTATSLPQSPTQLSGNCLAVWNHIAGQKIGRTKILGVWGQTVYEIAQELHMTVPDAVKAIVKLQTEGAIYQGPDYQGCTVMMTMEPVWFPAKEKK